jgi:hypothetical protein
VCAEATTLQIGAGLLALALFSGCGRGPARSPPDEITSAPLPVADSPSQTRFERLDAEETGIDFVHHWTPPKAYAHELPYPSVGGGVCVGDYDEDGRPDLCLTRPFGGCRLYRNLGEWRFEDVTTAAGLEDESFWGQGAAFADLDNDGDLDLFVCGFDCPNRLYLNQGDGTFVEGAEAAGLAFRGASIMMAFADYDLDGDLDGYLVTYRIAPRETLKGRYHQENGRPAMDPALREQIDLVIGPDERTFEIISGQYDRLYRNNGDGTYTDVTHASLGEAAAGNEMGNAVLWWDYNNDLFPDLYVANDFAGPDRLLHNRGDGTFLDVTLDTLPHTPWFSMGVDSADINNDGQFDLMGTDMSATSHYKQKMSMGDMTANGWFLEWAKPRQYMRNTLFLNSGTPRFLEAAYLTGLADTDWTWSVNFGDLDNDGWVDIFVANGMTGDWGNSDFGRRTGLSRDAITADSATLFADVPPKRETNMAFRNRGDLSFAPVAADWGLDYEGISFGAAYGDFDVDGDLDLVVNHFGEAPGVYRNQTAGPHRVTVRLEGTRSNRRGIGARVELRNGDSVQARYLTSARGFMGAVEAVAHFGLGDRGEIEQLTIHWPSGQIQEFAGLTPDRQYTVTEPHTPASDVAAQERRMFKRSRTLAEIRHLERPYDDYQEQPLLPYRLSQLGPGLAWADVDGNGLDDLYVGGAAGSPGLLVLQRSRGVFVRQESDSFTRHLDREDMGALFFDVDGDGDMDLYVVSGGVERSTTSPGRPADEVFADRLYLNDGTGAFTEAPEGTIPGARDSGGAVAAADVDQDGDLDLFVGGRVIPGNYPAAPDSRLLRNEGGRLVDVTDEAAPGLRKTGLVTGALWSDADSDGDPDLLLTHEWGPVKLFVNEDGNLVDRTAQAGLAVRTGWYNGISGRDVDNDGDIDYVVTNVGLNTKYHASADQPVLLYYGDFEGGGPKRLVEAEYEEDTLFPIRGKSCSEHAMPFVTEQFPSFHEFAVASLAEIYTPRCLDEARRFEANSFESGLLINDGSALFTFQTLPRLAQISPGFGTVLTDVDGDGTTDLYLVQNFFAPQRETGRMDGGVSLLLTGNGDGSFDPVWPDRSGLLVPGDAKALTCTDLNGDGWVDFVVSVNDGEVEAFENRGSGGGGVILVGLRGRPGNPTAVGARVTVEREQGPPQTDEVRAGGGYLSQSSSRLTFGLGADKGATRIQVRWPDGVLTAHVPPPGARNILLEQPGEEVEGQKSKVEGPVHPAGA